MSERVHTTREMIMELYSKNAEGQTKEMLLEIIKASRSVWEVAVLCTGYGAKLVEDSNKQSR